MAGSDATTFYFDLVEKPRTEMFILTDTIELLVAIFWGIARVVVFIGRAILWIADFALAFIPWNSKDDNKTGTSNGPPSSERPGKDGDAASGA